jgi:hypothetical protein
MGRVSKRNRTIINTNNPSMIVRDYSRVLQYLNLSGFHSMVMDSASNT